MQDIELAYTSHPAVRPKTRSMSVVGAARREDHSNGLAVMAVSALVLAGSAAMMSGPRGGETAPIDAYEAQSVAARPFEARAAAPVQPAPVPAEVELRASSPLPFAGDALGPNPVAAAAPQQADVFVPAREQHVLTSFDGTRTLSDGPVIVASGPPPVAHSAPLYAPTVWNNPLRWISVHKEGM